MIYLTFILKTFHIPQGTHVRQVSNKTFLNTLSANISDIPDVIWVVKILYVIGPNGLINLGYTISETWNS